MARMPNSSLPLDSLRKDVPAVLLVGGMGTRLRSVLSSKPKPLAPLGEMSFLEVLVQQLRTQGMRRLVMCTGFQADQVEEEFGNGSRWDVEIAYSKEACPLGTAGALKLAEKSLFQAYDFLVMNGDSFLECDFHKLLRFHRKHGGEATIAARRVPDAARYGTILVDEENRIVRFSEKAGKHEPGLVNGGVYVFNRKVLEWIPEGPSSLEHDILPRLLERGVFALEQEGMFIDIGTPEDYARAQSLGERLAKAARTEPHSGSQTPWRP